MTRTFTFQPISQADTRSGRVPTPIVQMVVSNDTAGNVPVQIIGAASQSAHLTDWNNSTGTNLAYVDASGNASFAGLTISGTISLPNNSVTNAMLAQAAANTVKGNATGSTANETDISIGTNTVLGRVAGNIVAAQLVGAQVTSGTLAYSKIQNTGSACIIGDPVGGSSVGEITLNATLEFSGSTLRRAALTGDVTAPAGSNALTIGSNKVTVGMLAQAVKFTLLGNPTNATANITAIGATSDGDLFRVDGSTISAGKIKIASFSTGPGIVTLACIENQPALSVTCRSANSSGALGQVVLATNAILQNQSSVLVSTAAPINLDLSNSGNDLGSAAAGAGCKGRPVPFPPMFTDASGGTGLTTVDLNIDGTDSATTVHAVPIACKITAVAVNFRYGNASAPTGGPWRLVVFNDTTSSAEVLNLNQSNVSYANNVTTGALSNPLAFSAGDRIRAYIEANGATSRNGVYVSLTVLAPST